jgi:hypothetical protein
LKTNEDIEAKIAELKAVGSPSALSKARELEWVLGHETEADEEADMLADRLLGSVTDGPKSFWDQVPEFARTHNLYTFSKQSEAVKNRTKPIAPAGSYDMDAWDKYYRDIEEYAAWEREQKFGKSFHWKDLLGADLLKTTRKLLSKRKDNDHAYDEGFYTKIPDEAADIETAELISSLNSTGMHRPLLDIDFPAVVIPSTTPGHGHLYIDKEMSWKDYKKLLNLFADLGIIEHGYRGASLARGYSALRLPWIKKEKEEAETLTF